MSFDDPWRWPPGARIDGHGASSIDFSADDHDGISHVVLRGRLDTTGVGEIETRFTATVVPPARPAIVDLSAVDFISSMGLRLPIGTTRALSQRKARLVLFGAQPPVADTLESAGLLGLIPLAAGETDALALADRLHLAIGGAGIPLEEALETFRTFLAAAGLDPASHYTATLAFEELVVNMLRHAGIRPGPGQAIVEVAAVVADDAVRFRVEDRGPPFDPTAHPEPPTPASIDEAPIGGLGIQLVRRSIDHARTEQGNRVDVTVLRQRRHA